MYLHVEHRKEKFKKTWKLESKKKAFSVGHSRHADLRLDQSHSGIAGMFEYRDGQWAFTNLNHPELKHGVRHIAIQGPTVIPLKDGELRVSPFAKTVDLFSAPQELSTAPSTSGAATHLWLVWKRQKTVWYSEFVPLNSKVRWPHSRRLIELLPTQEWQTIENEGLTLSFKMAAKPETAGLFQGSFKTLMDPKVRPYLLGATVAFLLTGLLSLNGHKTAPPVAASSKKAPPTSSTIVRLEKKAPPEKPAEAPKNAVAKALANAVVPKTSLSAKSNARRALGRVFSQIGKNSLKNIAVGSGPKTIALTNETMPAMVPSSAKTFKALGSLGSGTGLQPSQFHKGQTKDGGVGLGSGPIGGQNLGQISQGNVGQGNLGLLHKESEVSGGLDRDVIAKYINSQKGKILFCYERQLSANPGLFGKVSVKFQITGTGRVDGSTITESTLGNKNVEGCLLQLMANWQFPEPKGGVRVLVSYPFVFKSLN